MAADTISVDSIEYELIILDPGFDTWLLARPSKEYHTLEFYENMNRLFVAEWNYRYTTIRNHGDYDSYIDYNPETDYGIDLNYKLYYYFRFLKRGIRRSCIPLSGDNRGDF